MILTTLVTGPRAREREAAIASVLDHGLDTAVILEGFPDANDPLAASDGPGTLRIARIGAACPCCGGNLIFRVTLNRLLRPRPQRLYISLRNGPHNELVRDFLRQAPYDKLLSITKDLQVYCRS